jgi:GTP-binding protein
MDLMTRPIVSIIGRPNVGKSTLFNRLLGDRRSIVEDLPGTTVDRIHTDISFEGHDFTLVDCGGLEIKPGSAIRQKVKEQVEAAIAEADLVLFLVDVQNGVVPADEEIADILRRSQKSVLLVVNKVDNPKHESEVIQFYELGAGEPIPVSAYHGRGINDLLDKIISNLPSLTSAPTPVEPELLMGITIVGRPNVGKSLLVNTLLGEERVIVDEVPGTTRDAVDTVLRYDGEGVVLIDTAGIRKRGQIEQGVERYSLARTLRAIDRSDVVVLLIDAVEGIAAQDLHILGLIQKAFKGAILGINKWDLVEVKDVAAWTETVKQKARFMSYVEILFLSAKTGFGVEKILPAAREIYEERLKRLDPSILDQIVRDAEAARQSPKSGRRRLKIRKAVQTAVNPPTFVFFVNDPKLVHFSYQRYLENKIRQISGFRGTPLRLLFKGRGGEAAQNA